MVKFSVIVPVYNTVKCLNRCIDSILKQTCEDYELIIASTGNIGDNKEIIHKYHEEYPDKIKIIHSKSAGSSSIKNKAIHKALGEYILFVDGNDYIERGLLKTLNSKLKDSPDIIRFQVKETCGDKICMYRELPFETVKGDTAFKKIMKYHYVDNIEFYLYKREFIDTIYRKQLKHIDDDFFALGSFLILQAKKVKSIGYVGYIILKENVIQSSKSSIELLYQYKDCEKYLLNSNATNLEIWKLYVANILIRKTIHLKSKTYKEYLRALDENNIFNLIHQTGFERWLICNHPKIYYKLKKTDRGIMV